MSGRGAGVPVIIIYGLVAILLGYFVFDNIAIPKDYRDVLDTDAVQELDCSRVPKQYLFETPQEALEFGKSIGISGSHKHTAEENGRPLYIWQEYNEDEGDVYRQVSFAYMPGKNHADFEDFWLKKCGGS
jgi:hypothetical protein